MEKVYHICFWIGLIVPCASLLLSGIFSLVDLSLDFMMDGSVDGPADIGMHGVLGNVLDFIPSSPLALLAFSLVFGGVGSLLAGRTGFHVPAAVFCGWLASTFVARCVLRPLKRAQRSAGAVDCEAFLGHRGKITQAVMENGYGVVTFETQGGRYSFIAIAQEPIGKGEEVLAEQCDRGKMRVTRVDIPDMHIQDDE